jgi:signal transduction histidine kinase
LDNEIEVIAQSGLKALILEKLGRQKDAFNTISSGLTASEEYNDIFLQEELLLAGVEIAQNVNKIELQLKYANRLFEISLQTKNKKNMATALRFQADALAQKGDFQKSYQLLDDERKISDSLNDANFQARITAIETHYKIKQKDSQISDLESTTKIQETSLDAKNNQLLILTVLILALVVFIIAAIWFYFQDKKSRKKLELNQIELSARNQQLDTLNKSKNKLFQIMAHDLRGPIGSLVHLPTIYDNLFKAQDLNAIHEMNQVVFKTMKQLHQLLDSLLTWATAESGQITITPQWLKIADLFNAVNNLYAENLILKQLTLELSFDANAEVWADNNSTYTVLRNLIGNAIKFSHPKGTIKLSASKEGEFLAISVRDSGKGMPQDLLEKLFQVGEGKKSVGTQGEKGTGLGLLIVKEMVQINNGQIEVESEFGKGTQITIWLPSKDNVSATSRSVVKLTPRLI